MTYVISDDGEAIQCLICGSISYNPGDIKNRYCGHCHEFHDELARRLTAHGVNE